MGAVDTSAADVFPELGAERAELEHARACRHALIVRYEAMLAGGLPMAADDISAEYGETVLRRALADLAPPDAADFFGRIDMLGTDTSGIDTAADEVYRIGKRHIDDGAHHPVVIDWRAAVAAPFYRATVVDPVGVRRRRRYSLRGGALVGYNDEHLDDPDGAVVAGGIPDPVLAEMGAARTGAMREIVATIQAEQDVVIRTPLETCLVVQGGPGTGKTAVGLHRAAYLLFEHRQRLEREGVLVVGPNRVFLAYIADVLPSLGERSVQQRALAELMLPKVAVTATDPPGVAALKGDAGMATVIERGALARLRLPTAALRFGHGLRHVTIEPAEIAGWVADAVAGRAPLNRRREAFRALAAQEVGRRLARADGEPVVLPAAARTVIDRVWPVLRARELVSRLLTRPADLASAAEGVLGGEETRALAKRRRRSEDPAWTPADLPLLDEATGLLDGPPATFGHVVVDEAQDLTPMELRAVARRAPGGSLTVLGDLAQATTHGAPGRWDRVLALLAPSAPPGGTRQAELTVGYRVPAPILEVANRLLAHADVDVPASRSARLVGEPPTLVRIGAGEREAALVAAVRGLHEEGHALTGVITTAARRPEAATALAAAGFTPVDRLDHLRSDEVPVLAAEAARTLELDGVVVVESGEIADGTARGARLLYVALTRAVQRLVVVAAGPLPAAIV